MSDSLLYQAGVTRDPRLPLKVTAYAGANGINTISIGCVTRGCYRLRANPTSITPVAQMSAFSVSRRLINPV